MCASVVCECVCGETDPPLGPGDQIRPPLKRPSENGESVCVSERESEGDVDNN